MSDRILRREVPIGTRHNCPELAEQGYRMLRRELPEGWDEGLPRFATDSKGMATRDVSERLLNLRVAVEQASTFARERYTGLEGRIIAMKTFGASAPLKELQREFGFEPNLVVQAAKQLLGRG